MKVRGAVFGVVAATLVCVLPVGPHASVAATLPLEPTFGAFTMHGTNGYSIAVSAFSERPDGTGLIRITATRGHAAASYRAPATVTESEIQADLGGLGRIDVSVEHSGRERTVRRRCGGPSIAFEPVTYEGTIEFDGEEGYTRARRTRAHFQPLEWFGPDCNGSGWGEETGPGLPGARLRGVSFAHGRKLSFELKKNRPKTRTLFSASLKERRGGISIERSVRGVAPPSAFRFERDMSAATLEPPAPFSGSASIRRSPNSVSPIWRGDLSLDFPGRSDVRLAGPGAHVSLVHVHFTHSNGPFAEIGA